MFTGQSPTERALSEVAYHPGIQSDDHLKLLRQTIVLLDRTVAAARGHSGDPEDKNRAASLDLILGFGMLAMSEARAAIALLSLGLERSARIHLRSLFEYAFRAELVANAKTARAFKLAASQEAKRYAKLMGATESEIEAAEKRFLIDAEPDEVAQKEKAALGGDMATLVRNAYGDEKTYAASFGFPSLFSHGSILALYEVSKTVAGLREDFPKGIFFDGMGEVGLIEASIRVQQLTLLLVRAFGVEIMTEWDAIDKRLKELAKATKPKTV